MTGFRDPTRNYTTGAPLSRDESWLRPKAYGEKWPKFGAEIPPELAEELDARIGTFNGPGNRAAMVRAGLRLYLEAAVPEAEAAIEGTAIEVAPGTDIEVSP